MTRRALLASLTGIGVLAVTTPNIASLFSPAPERGAFDVRYKQGEIMEWNPVTLQNTVLVDNITLMFDLPVLGVAEAASYEVGTVVGLHLIGHPSKGQTWAIVGRFVTPNTPGASDAISDMSSRTKSNTVPVQENRTLTTYGDLTTVGPSVTIVVGPSGRLLVFITSQMQQQHLIANPVAVGGFITVEFTGANVIAPTTADDTLNGIANLSISRPSDGGTLAMVYQVTANAHAVFSGLNPGETTLTMKYANAPGSPSCDFGRRTVTAMAL